MAASQEAIVERLRMFYGKAGEDRIFARMAVRLPPERLRRIASRAARIALDPFPAVTELLPLWEDYLSFLAAVEDDAIPCVYPRRYDQGLYGTLFGAPMVVDRVDGPGWVCSMTAPLDNRSYPELLQLAANPLDGWLEQLESDLRAYAARGDGRWRVSVPITVDALNLAMQIRGNQSLLDIHDRPDDLKVFLQAGVELNITVVERLRAAIGSQLEGGVCDFFNAGWLPGQGIPMSVDCYNFCHPDVYSEFGLPFQQQLVDHFGAGNFHIHGNGRRLLPRVAELRGTVAVYLGNDGSEVTAFDAVEDLKRQAGSLLLVIPCGEHEFEAKLRAGTLPGGVYYHVAGLESIDAANRLMDAVRSYRA